MSRECSFASLGLGSGFGFPRSFGCFFPFICFSRQHRAVLSFASLERPWFYICFHYLLAILPTTTLPLHRMRPPTLSRKYAHRRMLVRRPGWRRWRRTTKNGLVIRLETPFGSHDCFTTAFVFTFCFMQGWRDWSDDFFVFSCSLLHFLLFLLCRFCIFVFLVGLWCSFVSFRFWDGCWRGARQEGRQWSWFWFRCCRGACVDMLVQEEAVFFWRQWKESRLSQLSVHFLLLYFAFLVLLHFPSYPSCHLAPFISFAGRGNAHALALFPSHVLPVYSGCLSLFLFISFVFYLILPSPRKKGKSHEEMASRRGPRLFLSRSCPLLVTLPHTSLCLSFCSASPALVAGSGRPAFLSALTVGLVFFWTYPRYGSWTV